MQLIGRDGGWLARISDALVLSRHEIRQGRFQRTMAVITAFAAIVSGFEAYVQHQRGAFKSWLMWTPVWLTPPTVLAAVAAIFSRSAARRLLPALSIVALVDGIVGFIYHLKGIRDLPGGFKLGQYNIVMGPPIFAPLLVCTVGFAGFLSGLLRRETYQPLKETDGLSRTRSLLLAVVPRRFKDRVAHGRFQRWLAIATAVFGILAGGEAYFEHLRGSFNQRIMWTPVWITPPMVIAAIGAVMSKRVATMVLPVTSIGAFLDGLLGFVLHLRGIQAMPGGFRNLRFNITMGPPLFAPLLFTMVGLLGFITSLLRSKEA